MGEPRGHSSSISALLSRPSDLKLNPDCADIAMVPATGTLASASLVGSVEKTKEVEAHSVASEPQADPQPQAEVVETHPAPAQPSRLALVGVYAFTASLALAAVALVLWGPLHDAAPVRELLPQPGMFAVVCVLWTIVTWAPVSLDYRGRTYQFVLGEVPMLLGLIFLSPTLTVLCSVCADLSLLARSRKSAPVKLAFNLASDALCTAVTVIVYREVLGAHTPVSLRGWAAAAIAMCTTAVFTELMVRVVLKLYGQPATQRRTGMEYRTQAMLMLASICFSFVVLDAAWLNLWALVPLLLVAALIIAAYRGYVRLSLRNASLQGLYDFTRALNTASLEPSSMTVDVLRQVCSVMRARRVMLVFAEPAGVPRRISYNERGASKTEPISLDESSIFTEAIAQGTACLLSPTGETNKLEKDPIAGRYREAIVAPLIDGQAPIGAIAAFDRDENAEDFDEDDLRLFETLVAHASAGLERARLVEKLTFERDSKDHQAKHDALTGLPNRTLFLSRAAEALDESDGVAIVLLDFDRFKDVNDTLGHAIGDHLLCEVSERLVRTVSGRATVARLGGDEFALVIADVGDAENAVAFVSMLQEEMSRPIRMEGLTLAVTASAGIALAPEHGEDVALLLQRADIAMYLAKERRSKVELYSGEHDRAMARRVEIGRMLEHALEKGTEFSVAYQPIAKVSSGHVECVEALVRWTNPVHGPVSPEEFIGIAEQMGVINQISDFVLAEACSQMAAWRQVGLQIGLAINLSGHEISDPGLVDRIAGHLKDHHVPPGALTLEVTETAVMADLEQVSLVLDELAALGINIAIDDYGTGYSSLAYIHRLPVQELKIDRSFVTNLPNESSNAIIVHSSIAMAHSLGLYVVAEGAEDEVTCAMLAEAECDFVQGYYLAKPMTSSQLQSWLLQGGSLQVDPLHPNPPVSDKLPLRTVSNERPLRAVAL